MVFLSKHFWSFFEKNEFFSLLEGYCIATSLKHSTRVHKCSVFCGKFPLFVLFPHFFRFLKILKKPFWKTEKKRKRMFDWMRCTHHCAQSKTRRKKMRSFLYREGWTLCYRYAIPIPSHTGGDSPRLPPKSFFLFLARCLGIPGILASFLFSEVVRASGFDRNSNKGTSHIFITTFSYQSRANNMNDETDEERWRQLQKVCLSILGSSIATYTYLNSAR